MTTIPFCKCHGAKNDFLLTWRDQAPEGNLAAVARSICDRHTGVGADGWMLVQRESGEAQGAIHLFNSDGSEAEISGNGTRCAAAFLIAAGEAGDHVRIRTGAGIKHLELLERDVHYFRFRMNMGRPSSVGQVRLQLSTGVMEATLIDAGNPQCAIFVESFDFDWRSAGREIETHPMFPRRTNVSFSRILDGSTIDVRFWERGAGETMSSGTGSTGAAFAFLKRGGAGPVAVRTPAGELSVAEENGELFLVGPAEIVGNGEFFLRN